MLYEENDGKPGILIASAIIFAPILTVSLVKIFIIAGFCIFNEKEFLMPSAIIIGISGISSTTNLYFRF